MAQLDKRASSLSFDYVINVQLLKVKTFQASLSLFSLLVLGSPNLSTGQTPLRVKFRYVTSYCRRWGSTGPAS